MFVSTPTLRTRRWLALVGIALTALGAVLGVRVPQASATTDNRPIGHFDTLAPYPWGLTVTGWALDPDTTSAIKYGVSLDGKLVATHLASTPRADVARNYPRSGPNHGLRMNVAAVSGRHSVCLTMYNVGLARTYSLGCKTITLALAPWGTAAITPIVGGARIKGWVFDYDARATAVTYSIVADGTTSWSWRAYGKSPAIAYYGSWAGSHGYNVSVPLSTGTHKVCMVAKNIGAGANKTIACRTIAVPNRTPNAPQEVQAAVSGQQGVVSWQPPVANGGSVVTKYVVTSSTGSWVSVASTQRSFTFPILTPQKTYSFTVHAVNAAGTGVISEPSNPIVGPPPPIAPVTSNALVSTSRYIRNIHGVAKDTTTTFAMGATDASYNPSHHRYLMLLDIGGQTTTKIGLSATSIYITYAQLVTALEAYIDGYASTQKYNAPAIIAIGVNNDIDVRALTGQIWADQVIDPLVAYARKYPNIEIAGANDMEPGFIGTAAQTKAWLTGYLGATTARFVFNGSADGCSWTKANGSCNNGWTAADLQWLAGGAAPTRMLALPQIYNTTMAKQWKFISLTGVLAGKPKIHFAGPLTEWTACYTQNGGCGSLTNNQAWTALWTELNSDARVQQSELRYGTDLRIN